MRIIDLQQHMPNIDVGGGWVFRLLSPYLNLTVYVHMQ